MRVKTTERARKEQGMCWRPGCEHVIQPGERYFSAKPRYGARRVWCSDHYPRASETTTGKMADVYAAQEDAESLLDAQTIEDIRTILEETAERIRTVAEEYRDASSNWAGGQNDEWEGKADELESAADELDQWEPEEGLTQQENNEAALNAVNEVSLP